MNGVFLRSSLLMSILVALVAVIGCIAPFREKNDVITRIHGFASPSIEVVEWEFMFDPPAHIKETLNADGFCVIRVCDLDSAPAKYEDLIFAFFDHFTNNRLFMGGVGAYMEVEPRSRRASRSLAYMEKIEQNASCRYQSLAGVVCEWLMGGSSEKLIRAIDVAATDYMMFYRPGQRRVVKNRETYEWAQVFRVRLDSVKSVQFSDVVIRLNEIIKRETGRSDMIIYQPGKANVEIRLGGLYNSLDSMLNVLINMEQMVASGARVIYDENHIVIDHEFVDPHCCPRKW